MAKKRYSSPCQKFTVNIKKNGKQFPLVFPNWDNDAKRRYIIIEDEEVQKQLESLADFGVYYHLDLGFHEEVTETPTEQLMNQVETENLAEAKKYLSGIGIKVYPSMNKAKAAEAAAERNIVLTIKN